MFEEEPDLERCEKKGVRRLCLNINTNENNFQVFLLHQRG